MQRRRVTRSRQARRKVTRFHKRIPQLLTRRLQVTKVRTVSQTRHTGLMPANFRVLIAVTARVATGVIAPPSMTSVQHNDDRVQLRLRKFPHGGNISQRTSQVTIQAQTDVPQRNRQPAIITFHTARITFKLLSVRFVLVTDTQLNTLFTFTILVCVTFKEDLMTPKVRMIRIIRRPRQIGSKLTNRTTLLPIRPPRIGTFNFRAVVRIRMNTCRVQVHRIRFRYLFNYKVSTSTLNRHLVIIFRHTRTISQVRIRHNFRTTLIRITRRHLVVKGRLLVPQVTNPAKAMFQVSVIRTIPIRISRKYNR